MLAGLLAHVDDLRTSFHNMLNEATVSTKSPVVGRAGRTPPTLAEGVHVLSQNVKQQNRHESQCPKDSASNGHDHTGYFVT